MAPWKTGMGGPPWKCEDCGAWWAGLEHRCQPAQTGTSLPYDNRWDTTTTTVRCTCPPTDRAARSTLCPIHDVQVTFTGGLI